MQSGRALPPHPQPDVRAGDAGRGALRAADRPVEAGRVAHPAPIGRRSATGKWRFNDYPFGILASETYMILRALDLQGMHKEAADGLDQWLRLPLEPQVVPGQGGHHAWALPDRPLGHFSDGQGCLTHAEGIAGAGGHMDGVHAMGPGAIMFALTEHFRLTGDRRLARRPTPRA